jgi:hypothetical protein
MMQTIDAIPAFEAVFNKRPPPSKARRLASAVYGYWDLSEKSYRHPWPATEELLRIWADNHDITDNEINDSLYTWSFYDVLIDGIRVHLWIHFKNLETQILFDLSY